VGLLEGSCYFAGKGNWAVVSADAQPTQVRILVEDFLRSTVRNLVNVSMAVVPAIARLYNDYGLGDIVWIRRRRVEEGDIETPKSARSLERRPVELLDVIANTFACDDFTSARGDEDGDS